MSGVDSLIGQTISHYRVVEKLGGGTDPVRLNPDVSTELQGIIGKAMDKEPTSGPPRCLCSTTTPSPRRSQNHGSIKIVIWEGTTTIYYNLVPSGDLTTPNPDSFRQGTPVLTTKWRHQVIFDANPSPNVTDPPRTNLFFVTWWHTITSSTSFTLGNQTVSLSRANHTFRQHLVGGVDFTGKVNGKFAGYTTSFDPAVIVSTKD